MHRPLRPLLPPPHPIRLRIRLGHPPGNRTILLVELRAEIVRIPRNAVALPKIVIGVDGAGEARSVFVGWVGEADVFVFSVLLVGVVFVAVFVFVVLVALVGGLAFVVVVVGLVGVGGLFGGRLFVVVIGIFVVVVVDVVAVAAAAVEAAAHAPPGESPVASGAADTSPPVASAGVADTFPPVAVGGPTSRCVAAAVGFGVAVAADPDVVGASGVDAYDIALLARYWCCYC
mmetsp:Transcript_43684/g.78408  ORF Transcript_43684/g.78408 Transcript_43684/m.78408 type:complete len:231 (+) Transcript_43684:1268-1960(+)